ncbi:peptidoglycan editing factor PgeF [Lentibacillus cibarius]|uniref:Purine nucleoside phosphorylase n=1 Tax=Lentibacillus cibarius TaxID=2583219 RepID=A0A5S3QNU9_9BACI|nr:peptidoglycan editing factor PgeF [Lentibacillus cibarius]TMN23505.1 peptidoglycan editing factor PgeF [Lentibacillus cibarius]
MTEPFQPLTESILTLNKWQAMSPGLKAGFTTRKEGVSADPFHSLNLGLHVSDSKRDVLTNRKKLGESIGFPLSTWVSGEQTHSTNVHTVTIEDKGKGATAYEHSLACTDGLITNVNGLLCTAFFADCVPIFFLDPVSRYIGIAHAGWKGTVNGIGENMIEAFKVVGTNTENLYVTIGPSISGEFYEVDEHVIRYIPRDFHKKVVTPKANGRFLLDLKQLNSEILLHHGVLRRNIDMTDYCTFRDESLFFSHRRDNGKTGRMLGYIGFEN